MKEVSLLIYSYTLLFILTVDISKDKIYTILLDAYSADEAIIAAIEEDIVAVYDRDPACTSYFAPLLFFKGLTFFLLDDIYTI